MSHNRRGLVTSHIAAVALAAYRIAAYGADEDDTTLAVDADTTLMGVSCDLPTPVGGVADICRSGIAPVEYGGVVDRGDALTADSQGRAIAAVPGDDEVLNCVGHAEVGGVIGDIGAVLVMPHKAYGPAGA